VPVFGVESHIEVVRRNTNNPHGQTRPVLPCIWLLAVVEWWGQPCETVSGWTGPL